MRRFLGLLMLLAAPLAFGQYSRFDLSLQTAPGQAISGASVWILTQPNSCTPLGNGRSSCATLAPLAPLFANTTGAASPVNCGLLSGTGNQIQNPGKTNQFGAFCNYVTPGLYTVCYNSPYTGQICYPDQSPVGGSGGVGSGTVTDFFAGNLVPLFTTAVATPTTTPSLTFALSNAPNYTLFGNFTGSTAAPSYTHLATAGSLSSSYNSGSNTLTLTGGTGLAIQHNDSASGINQTNLDFNDTNPAPDAGFESVTFKTDSTGRLAGEVPLSPPASVAPLVTAPVAGQYVILYPHRFTITRRDFAPGSIVGYADGTNGSGTIVMGSTCSLSYTNIGTWDQYTLSDYPGISPSSVTAVYAVAVSGLSSIDTNNFCFPTLADPNWASTSLSNASANLSLPASQPSPTQQTTGNTGLSGSGIATSSTVAQMIVTGATRINTVYNIDTVAEVVYYTGSPVTVPNRLYVKYPINYDALAQTIYLDPLFPQVLNSYPLAAAPNPGLSYGTAVLLTGTTDCVSGATVNDEVLCKPVNTGGGSWVWGPINAGTGGGDTITSPGSTLTVGGTSTNTTLDFNLAHANTWSALQTLSAGLNLSGASSPLEVGGSAGSSGQCLISAGAGATPIYGTCATGSSGISGATTGQALIAGSATTATSSKALAGSGAGLTTGPTSSTNLDCAQFSGTTGQIADAGAPCGSGGGGGYTNVTGSVSETTVALINTACGSGTYYATTPLSIATGGTVSCPVQFSKTGLWTIASGQVVTFAQPWTETDGPNRHFAGSGTVVVAAQDAPIEAWGATPYTTQSAAVSGTDSTAALQACEVALTKGDCTGRAYYRVNSPVAFNKSNVGFAGDSSGVSIPVYGAVVSGTVLVGTTGTADVLDIGGTSSVYTGWQNFHDFAVLRNPAGTGTSTGVSASFTTGMSMHNVISCDSQRDFYFQADPYAWGGGISNNTGCYGFNTVSISSNPYGVYADATTHPFDSLQLDHMTVDSNGIAGAHGIYATGSISDLEITNPVVSGTEDGVSLIAGSGNVGDIQITNGVFDSISGPDFYCNGISQSNSGTVIYANNWTHTNNGNYNIDLENCSGIIVSNNQLKPEGVGGAVSAIYLNGGAGNTIIGNYCVTPLSASGSCLKLNGSSQNSITGNTFWLSNSAGAPIIDLINTSTYNTIQSNTLMGSASSGIFADSTSSNNRYFNLNSINPVAIITPISDAGTGNQLNTMANLAGGALGSVPYQTAANTTGFLASPTTSGHIFAETWQPTGSAIAPTTLDLNTWNAVFNTASTGSGATGCGSTTGCMALAEAGTAGTPTAANDYFRADTSHNLLASINGAAEAPIAIRLPIGTVTFTPGSGVTSASCASSYTCTNSRGEFTLIGGTATTGTIATVNFSTTLGAAPFCTVSVNGNGGSSTTSFDLGHGLPSTSSFTVTAGVTVIGATINIDYQCQ